MGKENVNVPPGFTSDGCTVPKVIRKLLGSEKHRNACRRHDFECRYSLYPWWSANWHFAVTVFKTEKLFLKWRAALYFIGVTVYWKRCRYTVAKLPKAWEQYVGR